MIIVEGRERTGQIDISNIEILVKIKRDIVPRHFSVIRIEYFIPLHCAKVLVGEKSTAAQVQTITEASVGI